MKNFISKLPKAVKIILPVSIVIIVVATLFFCEAFKSKVEVPKIVDMSLEEASEKLVENGLTIFVKDTEVRNDVDENTVLSQNPSAGDKLEENGIISVVISEKSYKIEVPDVTDHSKDLAIEKIEESGAKVTVKEEFNDEVPKGSVISQSVSGSAMSGDTVTITVSKGSQDSDTTEKDIVNEAPDVVKMNKSEAKKTIEQKGLKMVIAAEEYNDKVDEGIIISQKFNKDNQTVEVVVSKGSQKNAEIVVPNVTFRTQSDAKELLEARGFKVKVLEANSNVVSKGAVISQSLKAGTKAKAGTVVTITVSTGKEAEKTTAENKTTTTTAKPSVSTTKKPNTTKPSSSSATTKPTTTKPTTVKPTTPIDVSAEKKYVADFKITTDKTTAKAGDEIKVSVALKTNYRIFTVMLPVIYDSDVFEMMNTSSSDVSSYLTFEGQLSKTYKTNGNWKSVSSMYSRNNNPSYWTQSDVMKKWKIAYASWAVDVSESRTPVQLTNEETIVTFTLKVKSGVTSTEGKIFISPDFQKTTDCVKGILAVGRCKNDTVDMNFVDRDQTIKVDRANVKVKIS
ncbi:MAG: PASTA domain-containing protein [Clostridia bacterium]|nr:PASTA domain-containing protein [Clostridia bacterium]